MPICLSLIYGCAAMHISALCDALWCHSNCIVLPAGVAYIVLRLQQSQAAIQSASGFILAVTVRRWQHEPDLANWLRCKVLGIACTSPNSP